MYPNITTTETRLVIDGKNLKEKIIIYVNMKVLCVILIDILEVHIMNII